MGLLKAFSGALSSTLADQWKDIFEAGQFGEHSALVRGKKKETDNGRGTNTKASSGVITNGSLIFVPENTACIIFSQGGIEEIITTPGGYKYESGQASVFDNKDGEAPIKSQINERFAFGGISPEQKEIAYVNLREIKGLKFGTSNEQSYYDQFYECELSVVAYGTYSLKIVDPKQFIREFVPAGYKDYTFDDPRAIESLLADLIASFNKALNTVSNKIKILDLPSHEQILVDAMHKDRNVGAWEEKFGIKLMSISLINISYSKDSEAEVKKLNKTKMKYKTLESISDEAIEKEVELSIMENLKDDQTGKIGKTILGGLLLRRTSKNRKEKESLKEQEKALRHYKKLLDDGIITQEEFDIKKKEILGL